jgi:hypothetical protein
MYESSKGQYKNDTAGASGQAQKGFLPDSLSSISSLLQSGKEAASNIASKVPMPSQIADLLGSGKGSSSSKAPAAAPGDRLHSQKQADAEAGFTLLSPEAAAAAADGAAADAVTAAAAAGQSAQDALSSAADEFPGVSSSASGGTAEKGECTADRIPLLGLTYQPNHTGGAQSAWQLCRSASWAAFPNCPKTKTTG